MKRFLTASALLIAALALAGCGSGEKSASSSSLAMFGKSGPKVPAGTRIAVKLTTPISSETSRTGDPWEGITMGDVRVDEDLLIPAGTPVTGKVRDAMPAKKGDRAMLDIGVTSLELDGKTVGVTAYSEPVIAGSPRARNLGAIAGGVAAGALVGKAVGGDGKDAATGAIIGGAAATAGVAASKGYQVVLKTGTVMQFDVQ